jgi:hypothetical protein
MPAAQVLQPQDIAIQPLRDLYDQAGLQTGIDSDGDLVVTRGVACYAIPARDGERIVLLSFVGIKDDVGHDQRIEFANRVNNEISVVRARVNDKQAVVFDYHIPIEGGVTGEAIVAATRFFLLAAAHAIDLCDQADIVR